MNNKVDRYITSVSSDDIPPEVARPSMDEKELHSFTKLAITYTGIGLGLLILFLGAGLLTLPSIIGIPNSTNIGYVFVFGLAIIMILTIQYLRKGKRIGAYLFFAGLVIYHMQYIPSAQYLLFSLIPSGVVSALMLVSFRHLR